MKSKKIYSLKDQNSKLVTFLAFLLICLLMGTLCFQYYKQLQKTIKEESGGYLQEISQLLGSNTSRIIDENFDVLDTVAAVIKGAKAKTFGEFYPIIAEQQKSWGFKNIFLIDLNGVAYDINGDTKSLGAEDFLQDVIVNKKPTISPSVAEGKDDSIVFSVPVQGITVGEVEFCAIAASYDLSTFDQVLSMTAFGGEAYAHVVQRDGSVIIRSSSKNADQSGYNIMNTIKTARMDGDNDFETLKKDIAAGENGLVSYTLNGEHKYMAYTPLKFQDWTLLTFVPVSVVNAKSNIMLSLTLLLCGIITVGFGILVIFLTTSFHRHQRALEKIAYEDAVTGGGTIQKFYIDATRLLKKTSVQKPYAMIYMNILKFKVLNEQFGRKACDDLLRSVSVGVTQNLADDECMGRQYADTFCILVHYEGEKQLAMRLSNWRAKAIDYIKEINTAWLPQNAEFGVYVIDNIELPLSHMIDRAKLSLLGTAGVLNDKMKYTIYDENIRRILLREKQLEDRMGKALQAHEFEVYLQPKYNTQSEHIEGAEALVRWNSPEEGLIYPGEFIPVFEKNGFVAKIDLFVFEEVCRIIERSIKEGTPHVRISVNCSRVHLRVPNFLNEYRTVVEKYKIPRNMLELEFTESGMFEDVDALIKIIDEIHSMGFECSMDDFGSGYSSLNLICKIPVDTLKLDRVFFNDSFSDGHRTKSVVGSIISMAKSLNMETVAEGIEEREQVDMLKKLDCDYIQGYYFAKPVPVQVFEQLLLEDVYKT
ncbi:MAG: EAL domain-containing protein [Anaerovoracaceae bacterium]